jgi:hypothetical protein
MEKSMTEPVKYNLPQQTQFNPNEPGSQMVYPGSVYKAVEQHPNIFTLAEDGVLEIYADNHMLSSLRTCEGYFVEGIINRIQGRGRGWSLTFGIWMHQMMEYFYQAHKEDWQGEWNFRREIFDADGKLALAEGLKFQQNPQNFIQLGQLEWTAANMDEFAEFKQYKALRGFQGAALLLLQYYTCHANGQERLRIVGAELSFGRNREVPIVVTHTLQYPFRAYLTGRVDLVVDNGIVIGPLDHKTTAYFDGTEGSSYKPHDGMCGYTYALNTLMGDKFLAEGKKVNTVVVNHICLKEQKTPEERFKRTFKSYTDAEFNEYVLRMRRTFGKLYSLVCLEEAADWNTSVCTMMYYHDCPFKAIHEVSPASRQSVIEQFYQIGPAWNPYNVK